ncbi:uncharacterized protein LOC106972109 isoform X2 [Acinonyx jubatus]|uniref:Uncharacterized protein LOC106972109 isoform X2 n=1 Tax=Acinonyx jubatus TaxID=32536 RepID=A0ABM3NUR8_ACIJB|nr:uncharacterized protein LOC106972109 isoform X2 [Acinonyx jubatus]
MLPGFMQDFDRKRIHANDKWSHMLTIRISIIQGCVSQFHPGGVAVAGLSSEDPVQGRDAGELQQTGCSGVSYNQTRCDLPVGARRRTMDNRGDVLKPESSR